MAAGVIHLGVIQQVAIHPVVTHLVVILRVVIHPVAIVFLVDIVEVAGIHQLVFAQSLTS